MTSETIPWKKDLVLPVIAAPMFIVSGPELVIAQIEAGVVGSFPALNARPQELLEEWIVRIKEAATVDGKVRPFGVNLNVHRSNTRLEHDLGVCVRHEVPLLITSLQAPTEVVKATRGYGGLVFHDVTTIRHAEKAVESGADGLILVCAGAGGHGGILNPFAFIQEVRRFFGGTVVLGGTISNGRSILAAQALGADFVYVGTRMIATEEANARPEYKRMIVESAAKDIVYTPAFSGLPANYLAKSIVAAGLDPANITVQKTYAPAGSDMNTTSGAGDKPNPAYTGAEKPRAWRDIWSAGQGVGGIDSVLSVADCVKALRFEYEEALAGLEPARMKLSA